MIIIRMFVQDMTFQHKLLLSTCVLNVKRAPLSRGDLFKSFKNTTLYGLQTIQYFGSKLWNTLPLFIRVASSVSVFQPKLKTYFINSYS